MGRSGLPKRREHHGWAAALLLPIALCLPPLLQAQASPAGPFRFRVNTDLVQLPTLVFNNIGDVYTGLKPSNFNLSIDSGPSFPSGTRPPAGR